MFATKAIEKSGVDFISSKVLKPFDDEIYEGEVIEFFAKFGEESPVDLWRIRYEDGDEEDVELLELKAAIKFWETNNGGKEEARRKLMDLEIS